jgi:hypothetical protein
MVGREKSQRAANVATNVATNVANIVYTATNNIEIHSTTSKAAENYEFSASSILPNQAKCTISCQQCT